ncbi:unnamed protein product [Schistosoma margrebowiei]|uniref:Uncharacterized protein n=1 Tax=Schistosoma margrebowiei TaxID=48269 RepID=A0A3P8CGG9_9TREM|nr:unnamed protein product [Schistosoma margrebowiei]
MGLVNWICLHLRVDVHSGTRTQYHSLKTPPKFFISFSFFSFKIYFTGLYSLNNIFKP